MEKRTALVTGANRGMGLETCRQLARRGYAVVLAARNAEAAQAAAESLRAEGGDVSPVTLDVAAPHAAEELVARVRAQGGRIDVLINNAGAFFEPTDQGAATSIFATSADTIRRTLETNAIGAFHLCRAIIPLMRENAYGRVVNVSSSMGSLATMKEGWPAYRLSKTALNVFTRLFAAEVSGENVKVNSVCPGWVRTEMGGPAAARSIEEGVDTTIWLATLADDGPNGGFFQDQREIAW